MARIYARAGSVKCVCDNGIELGIDSLDSCDGGIDKLNCGYLAACNQCRLIDRVE